MRGVWEAAVGIAVRGFFGLEGKCGGYEGEGMGMRKVLDIDIGRR